MRGNLCAVVVAVCLCGTMSNSALADVVFHNLSNNGFFTPFNSSTSPSVRYGDGGWLGSGSASTLTSIRLGLATFGASPAGTTDLTFTFNDGDPSGLVFGSGATLYSTTIANVALPASTIDEPTYFDITIPLPSVVTNGGFNDIGFSIGVANFDFDGSFGFQCSTAGGQLVGFYTNSASNYNGTSWSLFDFGGDPNTGVANFVATVETPEPGALGAVMLAGLATIRRHNRSTR